MKTIATPVILLVFIFVGLFSTNCKKDNPQPSSNVNSAEINKFIWSTMQQYYLWVSDVPNLTNSQFSKADSLNTFLNKYSDHEKLFYALLYKYGEIDKWSWIVDDYAALENQLNGITKSMGYDFRLAIVSGTTQVVGIVRYVVKGSPADIAGIKRGYIFTQIDDQQITTSNYQTLLTKDSYKVSFSNSSLVLNGIKANLTAVEVHEDPIYLDSIYTVNNKKIGYLVFNGFITDYDIELNNVIKKFKDNGIEELILDLRYNSGGQEPTMVHLASMIYGTDKSKVFIKKQYNSLIQSYFEQNNPSVLSISFTNKIEKTDTYAETVINNLGLSKLYVIATDNTASASEVLIHGLRPYIPVTIIGSATAGKYVGSTTLKDYIDENGTVNPDHTWAIQPIIVKVTNSANDPDYVNGLQPDISIEENLKNLLPLGDLNEDLLHSAMNQIMGITQKQVNLKSVMSLEKISDSKDFFPHSKELIMENPLLKKNEK